MENNKVVKTIGVRSFLIGIAGIIAAGVVVGFGFFLNPAEFVKAEIINSFFDFLLKYGALVLLGKTASDYVQSKEKKDGK